MKQGNRICTSEKAAVKDNIYSIRDVATIKKKRKGKRRRRLIKRKSPRPKKESKAYNIA
jgi:hypothetical protein